jgi:hypothetical protein
VLWAYYLLWKLKNGGQVPILMFGLVTLALFFTRSIFQWPAIVVFAACLYLCGVPRRQIVTYVIFTGLVSGFYLAKQQYLFGLLSTSSFAGVNLANSIGAGIGSAKYDGFLDDPGHPTAADPSMPSVLTSKTKIAGQPNFNNIDYLHLNNQLLARYEKRLVKVPVGELVQSYMENATIYFRPSSTYSSQHVIVDRLPWKWPYERAFSAPVLPILLFLAFAMWCLRVIRAGSLAQGVGMLLPGLYIMFVSIFSDKGENMRFKFFLEPVMFVFLASQFYALARSRWTERGGIARGS